MVRASPGGSPTVKFPFEVGSPLETECFEGLIEDRAFFPQNGEHTDETRPCPVAVLHEHDPQCGRLCVQPRHSLPDPMGVV